MMIAQRLYEGIDLGGEEGTVGLITYMRTDSPQVSNDALAEVREFIGKDFGKEFLPESPEYLQVRRRLRRKRTRPFVRRQSLDILTR